MSKNSINKLSKRQILESLYYEQSQGNATVSRLVTTLARISRINPEDLAKGFADHQANQEFAQRFNEALRKQGTEIEQTHSHDEPYEESNNPEEENKE